MSRCARGWEVEAARDGRLSEDDLRQATEHRARCSSCSAEHDALTDLAARLREASARNDELALRRSRNVVLERASRPPEVLRPPRRAPLVAFGAAAAIAAGVAFFALQHGEPKPVAVVITASDGASFTRKIDRGVDRVELAEGAISFDVREHPAGARFVVGVPDGEIEDEGTRFRVVTRHGRTDEIVVEQGSVVYRRPGRPEVRLTAGEAYRAEAIAARDVTARDPAARTLAANPVGVDPGAAALGTADPGAPSPSVLAPGGPAHLPAPVACASARAATPPSTSAPRPQASHRVLVVGPAPRASSAASVGADPARDQAVSSAAAPGAAPSASANAPRSDAEERAEDEAYLRVVALLREGRAEEAKIAARAYVGRFPHGLRRREMDAIAE